MGSRDRSLPCVARGKPGLRWHEAPLQPVALSTAATNSWCGTQPEKFTNAENRGIFGRHNANRRRGRRIPPDEVSMAMTLPLGVVTYEFARRRFHAARNHSAPVTSAGTR